MAAQPFLHCTGPIHIWYRTEAISPTYVGTCVENPITEFEINYRPVYSSAGGPLTPVDREYLGARETISLDLNRYDERVISQLEDAPRYGRSVTSLQKPKNVAGRTFTTFSDFRLDRGSLLIANKGYYQLWLVYSFFGTAKATPDLLRGWYYFSCNTIGVYVPKQGNRIKVRRLVVEANYLPITVIDSSGGKLEAQESFRLKSSDEREFKPLDGLKIS